MPRTARLAPALLLLLVIAGGAPALAEEGAADGAATLYKAENGGHRTRSVSLTLRDRAREKDLPVKVTWPLISVRGRPSKLPVLVWSHGMYGSKDSYLPIIPHLATHGYVVIQPTHEDSLKVSRVRSIRANLDKHRASRVADVKFVIDSLETIQTKAKGIVGALDPTRIACGGHSFGAYTAQLIGGVTTTEGRLLRKKTVSHRDARVKCVVLVSPQGPGRILPASSFASLAVPAVVITGSKDKGTGGDATWRRKAYELAPAGNKMLVWLEGGDHGFGGISGQSVGRHPQNPEHVAIVRSTQVAWLDAHLLGHAGAKAFLASARLDAATGTKVLLARK